MLTVEFVRTYPDEKLTALLAGNGLEGKLREAADVSLEQQKGLRQVRSATARKSELRTFLTETQLDHLSKVGRLAARELPNLKETFAFSHRKAPYVLFRTTAEALAMAGEKYKDVLLKYGLSATALDDLRQKLAEFDAASEAGMQGRLQHIGASSRLQKIAAEITRIVAGMDGVVRFQFRDQPNVLDAWDRASSVITIAAQQDTEPPAPPVDGVGNAA
ncbi:MAG: hypothetical protein ABI637_11830 [Gemmatimonadota bacterium]